MTRLLWLLLPMSVLLGVAAMPVLRAAQASRQIASAVVPPSRSPQQPTEQSLPTAEAVKDVTHYALPPALYRKAHRLGQISFWGELVGTLYSWLVLLLVLSWRFAPKYRDWAERTAHARFLQVLVFAPPLILTISLLTIPLDIAQHWVSRRFGISIQGWGSWAWDWTKQEIVLIVIGTFLTWILYVVIRRSPRRWWLYFWLVTLPLMAFLIFVQPVVIDPLFHKFEPLAQKDPALTARLEQLVQRAGQNIPPSRMFWMGAGAKTTALNAYVTGVGASKRIVVWDTTIRAMDTPQIVFVVGHEMGHYVLDHIWKGLAVGAIGLFILFYFGFRTIGWVLERWGRRDRNATLSNSPKAPLRAPGTEPPLRNVKLATDWAIRGVDDWASLPALLLLVSVFSFIGTPIGSAVSRHFEHQADQYGLEVTHGLTPDSSQIAAQSFQILGQVDLADPAPNPVDVFLFYSHPPIPDRIRFALSYAPWAHGHQPEFVR
jgi:Zn-dependent protease with chaperone function